MIRRGLAVLMAAMMLAQAAFAVEPDEMLDDPVLEARARELSKKVRCVVCQNQDIDSSNAGVARDLRLLVRERLVAGDTDDEVLAFLVARYGDYVLFSPPWKPSTYALWLAPGVMILLGAGAVGTILVGARRRQRTMAGLSEADEAEIARIIKENTQEN